MAKKAIEVDRVKLQAAIYEAEKDGPLGNLGLLWNAAAEIYNKHEDVTPITFSVVMSRATAFNLEFKTKAGKRGRQFTDEEKAALGERMRAGRQGPRISKAEKVANSDLAQSHIEKLRATVPVALRGLVDAVAKGRRKAAEKLFCLQCMGYDNGAKQAIGECTGGHCASPCPLWLNRPYQKAAEIESEVDGSFVGVED